MCGIIGIIGRDEVSGRLVDGLRRLEYRGYDSAGVCTIVDGAFERRRAEGKLDNLVRVLDGQPLSGTIGIAHTRWATHGAPTVGNAHPHIVDGVALVHNGIIENFKPLRDEMRKLGRHFESETDSEVVAHLIAVELEKGLDPQAAVAAVLPRLEGAFAITILFRDHPDLLIGARMGAPLTIGYGEGETFLGSDALALAPLTQRISYLDEGDWAVITRDGAAIYNRANQPVEREIILSGASSALIQKGNHRHFMQKEIFEQPIVVAQTLQSYLRPLEQKVALPDMDFSFVDVPRITIVGCGTSSYAGMVAKYWLERFARVPVEVDVASEFRYREAPLRKGDLAIFISQSGETADTLAALRYAKAEGVHTVAVVNVPTSTIARESDTVLQTLAGPEIGVASTKAFTCQLMVLAALAVAAGKARGALSEEDEIKLVHGLVEVPRLMADALIAENQIERLAREIAKSRDVLYLGRGTSFPLALEGALKLKEISYIHAEGYAAGELKHGPIALIDETMPVVVIAPHDRVFEKTVSNMQEVAARGGKIILMTDAKGAEEATVESLVTIVMPDMAAAFTPMVYAVPVQLLAYHTAVVMGTDVDQPRNLAKSVTVE